MHDKLYISVFAIGLACSTTPVISAQTAQRDQPATTVAVLDALFQARITNMDARESIDPCPLARLIVDTALFSRFTSVVQARMIERRPGACGFPPDSMFPVRMVRVDSIRRPSDDQREVFLNVWLGEARHSERVLMQQIPGPMWVPVEILIYNFWREYRTRTPVFIRPDTSQSGVDPV